MLNFALNHMTVPSLNLQHFAALALDLDMVGVELRNDLARPLFDGGQPAQIAHLEICAVAEVKAFNDFDTRTMRAAVALMDQAATAGANAIALIPKVGGDSVPADGLRTAMTALGPELARRGLCGLIEPIGFANSSLRYKSDVAALIDALEVGRHFGLIHDTFHHALSCEDAFYPDYTKVVHISGVTKKTGAVTDLNDAHRVLVDANDRLGNVHQIGALLSGGYNGPLSFEAFSPDIHALTDPKAALLRSIHFIENAVLTQAA